MVVSIVLILTVLYLLYYRFTHGFLRAYGAFFLILLFFITNKARFQRLKP